MVGTIAGTNSDFKKYKSTQNILQNNTKQHGLEYSEHMLLFCLK